MSATNTSDQVLQAMLLCHNADGCNYKPHRDIVYGLRHSSQANPAIAHRGW